MNSTLYQKDYYLWLEETAKLLHDRLLHEVDIPNLIEEIESIGRSEKHAIQSNLIIIILHLLKYKYQPEKRTGSWLGSIGEHRDRIDISLADSPSLKTYIQEVFANCYNKARKRASLETELSIDTFPLDSPFTLEETLNSDFLPE
ncbi:MAG: DUF29 domain-containing protein [Cyanosarcina radialis HA8281-LM2]|jgi:hypothetical protein|nr:DUF29 domain-containing protein [Cyanosarcina radialis HA8281-LM2]